MTDHKAPPIKGYRDIPEFKLQMVNDIKESEEMVLRRIDMIQEAPKEFDVDQRWIAIARTHIEQGYMAMVRALMHPKRIDLPGDK